MLPEILKTALLAGGADGILGSQLLADRQVVLSPRRQWPEINGLGRAASGCMRTKRLH